MNGATIGETITPVEALAELARSSREDPLDVVLSTVAETVHQIAGFESVVVNVFRPAWDDYAVALAIDTPDGRAALEGTTNPRDTFDRLATHADERLPGVYFAHDAGFWEGIAHVYYNPEWTQSEDPEAWQFYDGLFVELRDSSGAILGNLCVDDPVSGRRPTDGDLRLLRAICSHAEHALDNVRRTARAAEMAGFQARLLVASSSLTASVTTPALLQTVCETIVPGLGFERVAAYRRGDRPGTLELCATAGWESRRQLAPTLASAAVEELLSPAGERFGCWLLPSARLFPAVTTPGEERSQRGGRGPLAWHDECLAVPTRAPDGALSGLVVIEDPADRLLPSNPKRRILRVLVDHVSAVQGGIETRERLHYLATHDPLTGVRNRRNLTELLETEQDVALLICDLDKFKLVNDAYGHEVGDRVLMRFGELLRELARDTDVPMRLGGEEFCMLLPQTSRAGALATAERLRAETARRMRELVPEGVTVSIGVAVSSHGVLDARGLLAAADRGLYAAKAAGRDRVLSGSV
ncbi:MAG: diguanylate cyclase [Solirubrobacteraceae bacterium]